MGLLCCFGAFLPLEGKGHPVSSKQHRTVKKKTTPASLCTIRTLSTIESPFIPPLFCVSPFVFNHFSVYFYPRCLLPCVWVHGPWPNGAARIWLGAFLRGPYQVFHETVNGGSGLLSQKEFPSSRHQVLQHLTEQQVTLGDVSKLFSLGLAVSTQCCPHLGCGYSQEFWE